MSRYVFKLPDLGEGTVQAEIVGWRVKPGDVVSEDDVIVEVMTDKAAVEVPAPVSGKVISTTGTPGDFVPVGSELIVLETDAGAGDASSAAGADVSRTGAAATRGGAAHGSSAAQRGGGSLAAQGSAGAGSGSQSAHGSGGAGSGSQAAQGSAGAMSDARAAQGVGGAASASQPAQGTAGAASGSQSAQGSAGAMSDAQSAQGSGRAGSGSHRAQEPAGAASGSQVAQRSGGAASDSLAAQVTDAGAGSWSLATQGAGVESGSRAAHGSGGAGSGSQAAQGFGGAASDPLAAQGAGAGAGSGSRAAQGFGGAASDSLAAQGAGAGGASGSRATHGSGEGSAGVRQRGERSGAGAAGSAVAGRQGAGRTNGMGNGHAHGERAGRVATSPAIRRRAHEAGVDLTELSGSGPNGRILRRDFEAFVSSRSGPKLVRSRVGEPAAGIGSGTGGDAAGLVEPATEEIKVIGVRRLIAQRMSEAKRNIPHFAYVEELDMTELESLRCHLNGKLAKGQPAFTYLPFLVVGLIRVLRDFPQCNAQYDAERGVIIRHRAVHVGVATQTPEGLKVPVVRNAQSLSLWELAAEIRRVTEAARTNKAAREELSGSTITVTSLGKLGGIASTPIINAPEVAILGVNRAVERPVVHEGAITIRRMMNLSSSFDHRFVDGHDAAAMIQALKERIEHPATLFID